MSDTEYGPAGVVWSGTETNELGPRDQLSQNQLPLIQLPINQLPINRLPTGQLPLNQLLTKSTAILFLNFRLGVSKGT